MRRVDARFSTSIPEQTGEFRWQAALGGGSLMDLGVYPLAFCRRLLGEDFSVDAVATELKGGVDARLVADLSFGDVKVRIGSSMIDPFDARLEIDGENGSLCVHNPVAPSLGNRLVLRARDACWDREVGGPTSWAAQLAAIVATLRDGTPYPFPADDPVASMRAIERMKAHPGWFSKLNAGETALPSRR
jgi:predicted dehydrogenase